MYNAEKYIKQCIESLYAQDIPENNFEIIVINDGSTDNCAEIVMELATLHSNIRTIKQKNSGLSSSRNKGIEMAKGNYLLFVDADDVLIQNSIKPMIELGEKYKVDILKGNLIKLSNKDITSFNKIYGIINSDTSCISGQNAFTQVYNPMSSYVVQNLYRTEFIKRNHLYFLQGAYFEDVAFTIHSYLYAERFIAIPNIFYLYRQHDESIMATINKSKLMSMNRVIQYIYNLQGELILSSQCKHKLYDSMYASLSINLWYLSHYKSLYPHRREVIDDLKTKIPKITFTGNYKQRFISLCYHFLPSLYISIRYWLACKKY